MENALVVQSEPVRDVLTVQEVVNQVQLIQQLMKTVLRDGEHYGRIPGCGPKPTLLKAGAEKLCLMFRLAAEFQEVSGCIEKDEFISYKIKCTLIHTPTGKVAGTGLGICNSRETKYLKPAPYSIQNTIYKMACKRALVAAVLVSTAASDFFTQDIEDMSFDKPKPASNPKISVIKTEPVKTSSIVDDANDVFFGEDTASNVSAPKKVKKFPTIQVSLERIDVLDSFTIKEELKKMGYRWNGTANAWSIDNSSDNLSAICNFLGLKEEDYR